ncbi:hypothetical protein [Janibacter alittae]|uniref:SPW repeat-containing protein n=1 Tax=Janibacter alittae TaxID=3115209 RepID=A0ABZ2MHR5_9MICO
MTTTACILRDIAVRTVTVIGVHLGLSWFVGLLDTSGGANIGAGLLTFVLLMVLSGLGGLIDGRRVGVLSTVVIWVATAVLVAVAMIATFDPWPPDSGVVVSDLWEIGPFLTSLVAVPALIGGLLTGLRRTAPEAHTGR